MKEIFGIGGWGLGNSLQEIPVWYSIYKDRGLLLGTCDMRWVPLLDKISKQITGKKIIDLSTEDRRAKYDKIYLCKKSPWKNAKFSMRTKTQSEFKDYCRLLDKLKIDLRMPLELQDWKTRQREEFDIVICAGGELDPRWIKKKYMRWNEVAKYFTDLGKTVACVGLPHEYIPGCEDRTNLSLVDTCGLISRCKAFTSNDTGPYHFAALIGIPNVPVFTCTNPTKNKDEIFHASSIGVGSGGDCFPCQGTDGDLWRITDKMVKCPAMQPCRTFNPDIIIDTIEEVLR